MLHKRSDIVLEYFNTQNINAFYVNEYIIDVIDNEIYGYLYISMDENGSIYISGQTVNSVSIENIIKKIVRQQEVKSILNES